MAQSPRIAQSMQQWRAAHAAAGNAERAIFKSHVGFESGLGPRATAEAIAEAARLRAAATALFEGALADMAAFARTLPAA